MIEKMFKKSNQKLAKKIFASIMLPVFVFQMSSLNFLFLSVAYATEGEAPIMVEESQDATEKEEVAPETSSEAPEEVSEEEEEPAVETEADLELAELTKDADPVETAKDEEEKIEEVEEATWDMKGKVATIAPVKIGKAYVAPQNEGVTVTFSKLPEKPGSLSIEEINLTKEQQELFGAITDKAYDITSDMENGTFEYDLTLPKPENEDKVEVKFAENVEELEEAEVVSDNDVEIKNEKVNVELNHFTTFIVTTYIDISLTIEEDEFERGDIVYVKARGLNQENKFYRLAIDGPGNGDRVSISDCVDGNTENEVAGHYIVPNDAIISENWKAELHNFGNMDGCQNGVNSNSMRKDETFNIVGEESEEEDEEKIKICHANGNNTYNLLELSKDGVLNGHLDHEDIIPLIEGDLPSGQNWDEVGQAIWNNDCELAQYTGTIDSSFTSPEFSVRENNYGDVASQVKIPAVASGVQFSINGIDSQFSQDVADNDYIKNGYDNDIYKVSGAASGFQWYRVGKNLPGGKYVITGKFKINADWYDIAGAAHIYSIDLPWFNYVTPLESGLFFRPTDMFARIQIDDQYNQTNSVSFKIFNSESNLQIGGEYMIPRKNCDLRSEGQYIICDLMRDYEGIKPALNEGSYYLKVQSSGLSGSGIRYQNTKSLNFNIDGTRPTLDDFKIENSKSIYRSDITVSLLSSDNNKVANVEFYITKPRLSDNVCDGNGTKIDSIIEIGVDGDDRYRATFNTSALNGSFCVNAIAEDIADSHSEIKKLSVLFDNSAPYVQITSPTGSLYNIDVEVRGTVTDDNLRHYWLQIKKNGIIINVPSVTGTHLSDSFTNKFLMTLTESGTYEITLAARDTVGGGLDTGNRSGDAKTIFTIDKIAPDVPEHVSPSNKEFINHNDFWFDWTNVGGAVEYEFQSSTSSAVDSNGALESGVWNNKLHGGSDRNFLADSTIHSYGADGIWYWQVRAIDEAGNKSVWTTPWKITIDMNKPTTPAISMPHAEDYFKSQPILNDWNDSSDGVGSGVAGYQIAYQYDDFHSFGGTNTCVGEILTVGVEGEFIGCRTVTDSWRNHIPNLDEQGGVTIWVRAYDKAGNWSDWSSPVHYYYDTVPPETPELESPTDESVVMGVSLTNSWKAVNGAVKYIYESWHNTDTSNLENRRWEQVVNAPATSKTASNVSDATFWWRVKAVDAAGNESGWSELWKVTVDNTAPTATVNYSATSLTNNNVIATLNPSEPVTVTNNLGNTYTFTDNGEFTFEFKDDAGNIGSVLAKVNNIDKAIPVAQITAPITSTLISGTVAIKGIVTDNYPHHYWLAIFKKSNGQQVYSKVINHTDEFSDKLLYSWNTKNVKDGEYQIKFAERDAADNRSADFIVEIEVDNTSPILSSRTNFSGWYDSKQISTFQYTDDNMNGEYEDLTCEIISEGENQTCSVNPNICDEAGNCYTLVTESNGANIDWTDPISTINGGEDNEVVYSNSWDGKLSGTSSDNLSGVAEVKLSIQNGSNKYWTGSAWQTEEFLVEASGTNAWSYTLAPVVEDTYTIKSHAIDNADNMENTYTLTIVLDKTIPEINLTINPNSANGENGWYDTTPEISLTANDNINLDKIEYQIDSQAGDWLTYSAPLKIQDGKHIFYYRSLDKAGNYSGVGVKNVKVDTHAPDEIRSLDVKYDGEKNTVKLDWSANDSDIDQVYVYRGTSKNFDTNSGSRIAKNNDNDKDVTDRDIVRGEKYYYKLVSIDEAGNKSDEKNISVEIPESGEGVVVNDEGTENATTTQTTQENNNAGENQNGGTDQEEEFGEKRVEGAATAQAELPKIQKRVWPYFATAGIGALLLSWLLRRRKMGIMRVKGF